MAQSQLAMSDGFIAASTFQGPHAGLVFKRGDDGRLGYWADSFYGPKSSKKRAREEMMDDTGKDEESTSVLDATAVRALLSRLESFISKNESDRLKYDGKPELYVDSEVELHACVQELHSVAATPELLEVVTQGKTFERLINLLTHTNPSIVSGVLALISEMSEINNDAPSDDAQHVIAFVQHFLEQGALDLVVSAFGAIFEWKVNEQSSAAGLSYDEDTEMGASAALQLLENILDINRRVVQEEQQGNSDAGKPELKELRKATAEIVEALTGIFRKSKGFHPLKLHASEVLSSLLLGLDGESLVERVGDAAKLEDALDKLLRAQAVYRTKVPSTVEEEEYYLNLTMCISTLCSDDARMKATMVALQGVELQLLILKQYAGIVNAQGALQVLRYASSGDHEGVCLAAVEAGALKHAFPFLMGSRALNSKERGEGHGAYEKELIQEHAVAFASHMVSTLHSCTKSDICFRLAAKFKEGECKKLKRVCALFCRYYSKVQEAERELVQRVVALQEQVRQLRDTMGSVSGEKGRETTALVLKETETEMGLLMDEEVQHAAKLQGGLDMLQHSALLVCFATLTDSSHAPIAAANLKGGTSSDDDSAEKESGLSTVVSTLRELCVYLANKQDDALSQRRKDTVVGWVARLENICSTNN